MGPRKSIILSFLSKYTLIYTKEPCLMIDSYNTIDSPLIFLDIDGTLLNSDYGFNDPKLPDYIYHLQIEKGFIFALNSNRSLEDIIPIAKQFSIRGPLIGENGVFSYSLATDKTEYFLDNATLAELKASKKMLELSIRNALELFFMNSRVLWRDTDTVKEISKKTIGKQYQEGDIVVLNNVFRRYTVSAHLFKFSNGMLKTVPVSQVKRVLTFVQEECDQNDLAVTYDPFFSNILVYTKKTSKNLAVKKIIDAYPHAKLYSIGDSMSDYLMTKDIGTFLSVKNAPIDVRRNAVRNSSQPYALGVRELLEGIQ